MISGLMRCSFKSECESNAGTMTPSIRMQNFYIISLLLIIALAGAKCHEKTLRKIVRNKSKMIQRPFDDSSGILSLGAYSDIIPLNVQKQQNVKNTHARVRTMFHRTMGPVETDGIIREKNNSRIITSQAEIPEVVDLRSTRNIFLNTSKQNEYDVFFLEQGLNSGNRSTYKNAQSFRRIPIVQLKDDNALQTIEIMPYMKENIAIPTLNETNSGDGFFIKGIKIEKPVNIKLTRHENTEALAHSDLQNQQVSYFLRGQRGNNTTIGFQMCAVVKTMRTNIEAQKRFSEFNIEPPWISQKHFWSNMFNSRYEYLMRNPKWPALKVILIPRTHVDAIFQNTIEPNNNSANKILSNMVKKMNFYANLTFTWNEISHLSQWWKKTTQKTRAVFRKLLKERRLEITTGCWVESDEATTHIFGLVHNLVEGHQWLLCHLGYSPEVAWLTNTATHSPTMTYLLALSGITKLIFTKVHYSWEEYFAEYQISDFVWTQNWNNEELLSNYFNLKQLVDGRFGSTRFPKNSVVTHYLQFNSDGFEACGPNGGLCATEFNFTRPSNSKLLNLHGHNIKEKSELLLEQYSKTGTLTPHNVIIAPIGGPRHFTTQTEFDYQYHNYQKIADFINVNRDLYKATIEFGTPIDYFNSIFQRNLSYPSLKGDFLNFADVENNRPSYWTGFFTTRPLLKMLLRRLQSTLRSTEVLFSFAVARSMKVPRTIELLIKSRQTVARLLDRSVFSVTLSTNSLRYVYKKILQTVKDCWHIQEILISLLVSNRAKKEPYVKKYVYRHGDYISTFRTVSPGDTVLLFNSLSHRRFEIVELFTKTPNIRVIDHDKKDVTVQANPVWKYNSENVLVLSRRFFKILFAVVIPPLSIKLFEIKENYTTMNSLATIYCDWCIVEEKTDGRIRFPFDILPMEKGDIQLENYKHRLIFDETSGFLKAVIEKGSNTKKELVIDYGTFRTASINPEMFLFNTNKTKLHEDILMPNRTGLESKIFIIVAGQVITDFTSVYGRALQQTVKICNSYDNPLSNAIYIESKVDIEVYPNNRGIELFMAIQTNVRNGNPSEIYVDNNGFQYTPRTVNSSRPLASNIYPMTTLSYIQDNERRLTVITDHAQGVTALREGQIVVMLDRRVLLPDSQDTEEGLVKNSVSCQRHYILLENFVQTPHKYDSLLRNSKVMQLPSFQANYLSNTFNYDLEHFIIENNKAEYGLLAHTSISLIKASYPCDVTLLNFRVILHDITIRTSPASTSMLLMILHRQSFTCQIDHEILGHCDVDTFSIDDILGMTSPVFKTNLAGTNKGTRLNKINIDNFPPMELLTLRIHL